MWQPHKGTVWDSSWYISLIYPARSCYLCIFARFVITMFLPQGTATSVRIYSFFLVWCQGLSVRLVASHTSITCSLSATDGGKWSYHLSSHLMQCLLYSSRNILMVTFSERHLYSLILIHQNKTKHMRNIRDTPSVISKQIWDVSWYISLICLVSYCLLSQHFRPLRYHNAL